MHQYTAEFLRVKLCSPMKFFPFQTFFLPVLLQIIRVFNFHEDQGKTDQFLYVFFFCFFSHSIFFLPIQFLLLETMANNDHGSLLEKPHLIFDCDESGFKFDSINKIVTAAQGTNHIPRVPKGQHKRVDVMVCASEAGDSLLPMFIFKSLSGQVLHGVQEGAPT